MKKFFLFIAIAVATMAANATTYALFGAVPEGATDLTDKVQVSTTISASADNVTATDYAVATAPVTFTGKGLGGSYVCHQNVAVAIRFTEAQTLSLTDKMAIRIKIKRADENTAGGLEWAICRTYWGGNGGRIGFEVPASAITTEESEIVLKYEDASAKGTYSTYGKDNFVGDAVAFTGADTDAKAELFRVNAANGEQFSITAIYLESSYQGGDDPVTPPTPEGNVRYYLYHGNNTDALPTIDEVTCIDVRPTANATVSCNSAAQDAAVTDYAQFTVNGSWCAIDHKPTATVANAIDNTYYLIVRFKTDLDDAAVTNNKLRFNLSSGAGNFYINNSEEVTYNDGKWHVVQLALADANGNKPSSYLVANQHAFQIHLDGNGASGKIIAIDYAYFTNEPESVDPATGLDCTGNTVLDQPVKFINNGQMFIRRGDVIYDLNGQQIR